MSWRKYEKDILRYFKETYPDTEILFDQKIQGKYSKVNRQIDILIEGDIAGYQIRIAVDCKYFSKNIDVKQVESFCSMVEDIEAHQGVLITQKGFSKAAINRAHYGNQKVELDIINFEELKNFQSFTAFPYIGNFGVIVPAPFGWVLDLNSKVNRFASIHQRGQTLEEAQKRNEWMYMEFCVKYEDITNIDSLIEIQNKEILKFDKKTKFDYNKLVKRTDKVSTKIRIAEFSGNSTLEVTGFIEFEEHIFFVVLITPVELLSKNIRKLQHILKVSTPLEVVFDNTEVIKQCLESIENTTSDEEKADKYFQIGDWFKEMDDLKNSFLNYEKGIECFPTHYTYLKTIIGEALSQNLEKKALEYTSQLFYIAPTNPVLSRDLIEIYLDHSRHELLLIFFTESIDINKEDEILGNLNFHLGLLYLNMEFKDKADLYIKKSKKYFEASLPSNHSVFKTIKEYEKLYS
ncbi:restriction endonuclease [Marinifilum fragile]|uniref:restriction endonuclease n=1 Tax=Marinifilum fragile TaxID=570161 RepID=UPI002AA92446|nr:restriction endonuclease [Marinifilum fragile]